MDSSSPQTDKPSAPAHEPRLKRVIGVFGLTMMNVATVASLRNLPYAAEYGAASALWYLIGGLCFFLPVALVAAELGSAFPHTGGVYLWVRAALGPRCGMLAAWLQWLQNVAWYPTILTFIAGTLAYLIHPALLANPVYLVTIVLTVFWLMTIFSLRGIEATTTISTLGVFAGTFLPVALLLVMGGLWLASGEPLANSFVVSAWLPKLSSLDQIPALSGVVLGLCGLEMPAVHARQVMRPQSTIPRATLLSFGAILSFSILGTLALVALIPIGQLDVVSAVIDAFGRFAKFYDMPWLMPLCGLLMILGALAGVANWVIGPCRALFATGRDGDLPTGLQKINRHGAPWMLLLLQGAVVSILSLSFLLLPRVADSFWLLVMLSSQLYMLLYILMFIAAWRLRKRNLPTEFRVPGGWLGLPLMCLMGIVASTVGFLAPFIPRAGLSASEALTFELILISGLVIFVAGPLVLYQCRRPSWKPKDLSFFD